jgi:Icc-related predicted phosphoesterase
MKFLCITDLHDSRAALERILADAAAAGPVDLVLLGGDITQFGPPEDAERLVRQAQAAGAPVLAVAGNCDSPAIDRRLVELGISLHGRGLVRGDVGIHGLSAIPPWQRNMHQFTEEELADALRAGYAQVAGAAHHVVLAHVPPHGGKLDRTHFFQHVGSKALRAFIEETHPELVVCGHIHEGRGIEHLGRTTVVNCGAAFGGYYALAEVGEAVTVELRRA